MTVVQSPLVVKLKHTNQLASVVQFRRKIEADRQDARPTSIHKPAAMYKRLDSTLHWSASDVLDMQAIVCHKHIKVQTGPFLSFSLHPYPSSGDSAFAL